MERWPNSLPLPRKGNVVVPVTRVIRSQMESGRSYQRRVTESKFAETTVEFVMSEAQLRLLQNWIAEAINDGLDWFEMDLDMDGIIRLHTVRMLAGEYQFRNGDGSVEVRIPLEIDNN